MGWPAPLWLADGRVPFGVRLMAFRLWRVRIRQAWMVVDPYMVMTVVALIVLCRIGYRAAGIELTVAGLLAGTGIALPVLIAALGALTKRSDRREGRAVTRRLRMAGFALAPGGRLVALER